MLREMACMMMEEEEDDDVCKYVNASLTSVRLCAVCACVCGAGTRTVPKGKRVPRRRTLKFVRHDIFQDEDDNFYKRLEKKKGPPFPEKPSFFACQVQSFLYGVFSHKNATEIAKWGLCVK